MNILKMGGCGGDFLSYSFYFLSCYFSSSQQDLATTWASQGTSGCWNYPTGLNVSITVKQNIIVSFLSFFSTTIKTAWTVTENET